MTDLEAAWNDLHDAKPDGWFVGQPMYHEHRREWEQYAFDTREKAKAGHRSREWTAVAAVRARGRARDGTVPGGNPQWCLAGDRRPGCRGVRRAGAWVDSVRSPVNRCQRVAESDPGRGRNHVL